MSSRLLTVIRLLLIPVLMWVGFVAYGYILEFFGVIIPIPEERSLIIGALLAQGFLSAAVIAVLFCYPLALLYQKSAVTVALVISFPVIYLSMPALTAFDMHPVAIAISAYEVLAYVLLLVVGSGRAHTHLSRSNSSFKRDALKHAP